MTPPNFTPDQKAFLRKRIRESVTVEYYPGDTSQCRYWLMVMADYGVGLRIFHPQKAKRDHNNLIRRLYRQMGV